jgi:hypothetical protein
MLPVVSRTIAASTALWGLRRPGANSAAAASYSALEKAGAPGTAAVVARYLSKNE